MKSRILPILLLGLIILLAWAVAQPPGTVGTVPPIATGMSNVLPVSCVAGQLYFLLTTNTPYWCGPANVWNAGGAVIPSKCAVAGTTSIACGASAGGSFSCSTSGGTCTVATTAVTASSVILISLVGVPPPGSGVTCATTFTSVPAFYLATLTGGTGFTINNASFASNVACYQYAIF